MSALHAAASELLFACGDAPEPEPASADLLVRLVMRYLESVVHLALDRVAAGQVAAIPAPAAAGGGAAGGAAALGRGPAGVAGATTTGGAPRRALPPSLERAVTSAIVDVVSAADAPAGARVARTLAAHSTLMYDLLAIPLGGGEEMESYARLGEKAPALSTGAAARELAESAARRAALESRAFGGEFLCFAAGGSGGGGGGGAGGGGGGIAPAVDLAAEAGGAASKGGSAARRAAGGRRCGARRIAREPRCGRCGRRIARRTARRRSLAFGARGAGPRRIDRAGDDAAEPGRKVRGGGGGGTRGGTRGAPRPPCRRSAAARRRGGGRGRGAGGAEHERRRWRRRGGAARSARRRARSGTERGLVSGRRWPNDDSERAAFPPAGWRRCGRGAGGSRARRRCRRGSGSARDGGLGAPTRDECQPRAALRCPEVRERSCTIEV
jgi:hypothetical protein